MTPYEEDLQRAHYFALGALHHYKVPTWDEKYTLATGFAHHYTRDVSRGLDPSWDAYVAALVALEMAEVATVAKEVAENIAAKRGRVHGR